jgi:hypothetical protein
MVRAKRSRDEVLAEEVTTPHGNPSMRGAQQLPDINIDKDDKRREKKSKTSHQQTQDEVEQPSQSLQGVAVSAVVPSAVAEYQEMSDASTDSDEEVKVKVPPTPTTTAEKAASFPVLAPISASDMANNRWAPCDPAARQAYLQEVGQLELHPSRTPLQTPTSKVSAQIRHMIYEKLFLGMTNEGCIQMYNSYGGDARCAQAVSKQFLPEAWKWFVEEKVVIPWNARSPDHQKALKGLGLIAKNFPAPCDTQAGVKVTRPRAAAKATKAPKAAKATRALNPSKQTQTARQGHEHEQGFTTGKDIDEEAPQDDEDDVVSISEAIEHDQSLRQPPVMDFNKAVVSFVDQDQDRGAPTIHEVIRAASNAFSVEDENANAIVALMKGGKRYNVHAKALIEHCGFVRNNVAEGFVTDVNVKGRDPVINSISPSPRNTLPSYDIQFVWRKVLNKSGCLWDPLGVIDRQNIRARRIDWNMNACVLLYDLAVGLDCAVVNNLVIDRMMRLIQDDKQRKMALPANEVKDIGLSLSYLCKSSPKKNAGLFRLIAGYHLGRSDPKEDHWPEKMTDEMVQDTFDLLHASQKDYAPSNTMKGYCQRFHEHSDDQPCLEEAAQGWKSQTKDLISQFFSELCGRSDSAQDIAHEEIEAEDPNDIQAAAAFSIQKEMMRWSLEQDERIAKALCELEDHRRHMFVNKGAADDKHVQRDRLTKLVGYIDSLREDQDNGWKYFGERWCEGDDQRKFEKKNSFNIQRLLEGEGLEPIHVLEDDRKEDGSWNCQYFFRQVQPSLERGHSWWY